MHATNLTRAWDLIEKRIRAIESVDDIADAEDALLRYWSLRDAAIAKGADANAIPDGSVFEARIRTIEKRLSSRRAA